MEKLDRLGWTAGAAFKAYGVRFGIRANRDDVLRRVMHLLPPYSEPAPSATVGHLFSILDAEGAPAGSVKRFNLAYANHERIARDLDLEIVLRQLESEMQRVIAEESRRYQFIHAGVVEWRGKAVVLPGRSLSGKSSLVVQFLRGGAAYYSDEYAVVDSRGRVHPFPRRIVTRDAAGRPTMEADPLEIGAMIGHKPLEVGTILLTRYSPEADWYPRRLSHAKAILALLSNSLSARRDPARALEVLQRMLRGAEVFKSRRGEGTKVVQWVKEVVE